MEIAAVTVLIVLGLTPGFLFWAGFYSPIYGYLEYDISSWRTPGQLARTLITAHIVHLALILALVSLNVLIDKIGDALTPASSSSVRGVVDVLRAAEVWIASALDVVFKLAAGELTIAQNAEFVMANVYLILAAALSYFFGYRFGQWGISPLLKNSRRASLAMKFIAHRFVYELVQDVQYRGILKTGYLLARFDDGQHRCIYRGVLEDFSFSKSGILQYVVLNTLAKANRENLGQPETSAAVHWTPIGHQLSGRAYFDASQIENAVFENAPRRADKFETPGEVEKFALSLRKAVEQIAKDAKKRR